MGNSNGNAHYYWDIFWNNELYSQYQGGFIWDFVDQGIRIPFHESYYYGYGGDFNDEIHDANFCINGLFSPDRIPHPAANEFKRLQQPVYFFIKDIISLPTIIVQDTKEEYCIPEITLGVKNRYSFVDLSHLNFIWDVCTDIQHLPIASGVLSITANDLSKSTITIPLFHMDSTTLWNKFRKNVFPNHYWFNLKGCLNQDTIWASKGHVVVQYQCSLPFEKVKKLPSTNDNSSSTTTVAKRMHVLNHPEKIVISSILLPTSKQIDTQNVNKQPLLQIDKSTGFLTHYYIPNKKQQKDSSINILSKPLRPNFTRASTDNDRGGLELLMSQNNDSVPTEEGSSLLNKLLFKSKMDDQFSYEYHWKRVGLIPYDDDDKICLSFKCDDISILHPSSVNDKMELVTESEWDFILICTKITVSSHSDINRGTISSKELFYLETSYRIFNQTIPITSADSNVAAATVLVQCKVIPIHPILQSIPSLPRVGMTLALPYDPNSSKVTYVGRGPFENYPDRKYTANYGYYTTTPQSMHEDTYIVPSENGNRCDCSWVSFTMSNDNTEPSSTTKEGACGVCIIPCNYDATENATMNFSTSLYSQKQLHKAKHTCDLSFHQKQGECLDASESSSDDVYHVNLDHALMGVGGDVR